METKTGDSQSKQESNKQREIDSGRKSEEEQEIEEKRD